VNDDHARADLRLPLLGVGAWAGGLAAQLLPWEPVAAGAALAVVAVVVLRRRLAGRVLTALGVLLVFSGVLAGAVLRQHQVATNPVAALAEERAVAVVDLRVVSDARLVAGRYGERVLVRAQVIRVTGRGVTHALRVPVLVLGERSWLHARLGSLQRTTALLSPASEPGLAALVSARGDPRVLAGPDPWWRGAEAVRESVRRAVAHRPPSQRALVPALVDGDDTGLDPALADDFRTTGLTHLLAVSGTNLTLVVGFLLVAGRWCGVRGRWLYLLGAAGIVGFVLLARTEPSVVRAAAMGTVGLLAMGTDGRERGARTLGAAVVGLLLLDPGLATNVGFALSVVATAGILLLAPGWRDALARWLPRWLAEAIAVPATAQLACTPLVAAISGQVSLVAVVANLAVAPVVGPATVLGLAAGLLGLAWPWLGQQVGTLAGWCVAWVVEVARRGADLPSAAVDWGTGAVSLAVLTLATVMLVRAGPRLLGRPVGGIGCCCVLLVAVLVRPPSPGWPPPGWIMVACDVGQGDALVVRVDEHAALVVDAGPDPAAVDGCLDRLAVRRVPLLVLTHFHADHIDGLAGVLDGRTVDALETSPVADPADGAADVAATARAHGLPAQVAPYAVTRRVGAATIQVLWPPPGSATSANDASVVLLVEVAGVRLLLTGDVEPDAQAALARTWPDLRADVLKVPHHGSRFQDLDLLESLGARLALVSAGEDNDYGHPAPDTLSALTAAGVEVLRTDTDGDVAVVVRDGGLAGVSGAGGW
jgi:competence protein ComEC